MRLFISMAAALALGVCALVACSPQDGSAPAANRAATTNGSATTATTKPLATPATPSDDARRISLQEAQQAVAQGKAIIVDVRDETSYKAGHIKGAKLIPVSQFEQRMGELPKDKLIITYCA